MRIKWNRHLDGSSSRRQDEETGTQEVDEREHKKRSASAASSSPSIFKIFRRKKNRRGEDESKTDGNNFAVPPPPLPLHSEIVEDDCASISSVATCASQPVTDGFQRDRSSSLFSSFRLSLPGSKRKKRKIAPTPSETVLNDQQQQENKPHLDRYSTPDLRKPSDKLDVAAVPNSAQVGLSTSSPSIRNNPKGTSTSAQSLDVQNSESLEKLKWSRGVATPSGRKLSKSVSFSDCKDGLADSPHSTCDNKVPQTVNRHCAAMVEEDSTKPLESELAACLSDNLRMSRESKFTAVDDVLPRSSAANAPSLQRRPHTPTVSAAVMTKTEEVAGRNSKHSSIVDISNILNDITTEIQSYGKGNEKDRIFIENVSSPLEGNLITSTINCDSVASYSNGYSKSGELIAVDNVLESEKNKRYEVRVDLNKSPSVQCIETVTDASLVPKRDIHFKTRDSSYESATLSYPEKDVKTSEQSHLDKSNNSASLNSKLEVLSSELSVLTTAKNLSELNCDAIGNRADGEVSDDDLVRKKCEYEMSEDLPLDKQSVITSGKHVVCHMKFYENEPSVQKSDDSKAVSDTSLKFENSVNENSPQSPICDTELADRNILLSAPASKSYFDPENCKSLSKCDSDPLSDCESSALNSRSENETNRDQKVPDNDELHVFKNPNFPNDQRVPEFELSLMEFEEVCSKYMSRSSPEFSYSNSTFPLYSKSPKRKSVLDLSFSFMYPNFEENGSDTKICLRKKGNVSPVLNDPVRQNFKLKSHPNDLQSSCQSLTEEKQHTLPTPPKQWNNHEKPIDNRCDVCAGVQCTSKVRGKYLCQEPCLEAVPTSVMLGDSTSGGIDTPGLSSTLQAFETESGREKQQHSLIVTGKKQQLSDVLAAPSQDMISNAGMTISTLNGVFDYSCLSESPGKNNSVFLDSQIRDTYRGPRAICDPLIYSSDVIKGIESLGPENYLSGHNFSDMRSVRFCEVISDATRDYVPVGNGLIEISNPYEDTFILPQDLSKQNLVSVSLPNSGRLSEKVDLNNVEISVSSNNSTVHKNRNFEERERSEVKNVGVSETSNTTAVKSSESIPNRSEHAKEASKLTPVEQKNLKNKNSMIPCMKRGIPNNESSTNNNNKRIETKSTSKKSNSLPRFNKTESHLPVKNSSSHRVFLNSCKDSGVEQQQLRGKRKDLSVNSSKLNGNCSPVDIINCETSEKSELGSNSQHGNLAVFEYHAAEGKISGTLLESSCHSNGVIINPVENSHSRSLAADLNTSFHKSELDDSKSFLSTTPTDNILSFRDLEIRESETNSPSSRCVEISDNISGCAVFVSEHNDAVTLVEEICPECLHLDIQDHVDVFPENVKYQYCSKHSDYIQCSRRSSFSAVGMRKTSYTSSKESLSSQLTSSSNRGKSRIPRKQPGTRNVQPSTKGPVRPPMWLSKAELTQEIQRLGTLCEARTKELNRLKMETKHVSVGFDAFAALFKYMVEDLNGLSVPALTEDLGKTLKQLELTKQDLAYYEREVEEMKSHHCQELNDLSNKLFEVYQSEVAELNAKHQEEINHLKSDHQNQIEHLTATFDASSSEIKAHHEKMIASLEQEIINQREELQQFQEREIKDLEEKHAESSKLLQDHIEQLQKKCAELKQHSMSMEDAMRQDTDSKLQWVTAAKLDLEKEVESLKAVLEMKNKELHTLRVQNLEMEKQLEELPFAREKIKMLQARAEDLEALMVEKTKLERKLSSENQQMRETYEKEAKVNRRLSMENEELQWRLRQAENSLISGSFSEVPEFPETEENAVASPTKSPPQMLSRSVFFTFVDKDEGSPHSPRSQYKKITPNFSANYKISPAKSSKSPPAPSPRRSKSHSDPPQPITFTSTPRKVAKQPLSKTKQKRHRSGSDCARPSEHTEVNFSSMTESMVSSVSSESSVFEHRERLLDEHKEHIIQSLEILREQRSNESSVDEPTLMGKKWCSDDIKITGELSNLETEDMSRSAEFSDPKTYYHMTFPVLKESGITDCDIEDGSKNSSSVNSPVKEVNPMHSMSENNIHNAVEASDTLQIMSVSSQEVSTAVVRIENKRNSCTELTLSAENVQREAVGGEKIEDRWRTI